MGRVPLTEMNITGHAFVIADLINVQVDLPVEIYEGCYLEHAPEASLDFLSYHMGRFFLGSNLFESVRSVESDCVSPLAKSDWRYYLLRREAALIPDCIVEAAAIIEPSLHFGPYLRNLGEEQVFGQSMNVPNWLFGLSFWSSERTVNEGVIAQWQEVSKLIAKSAIDYPEIGRVVKMFYLLSGRDPFVDRLTVLGYFAVIEALLTHQPSPHDTIDSITRQIWSKMILLGNRATKLDYSKFKTSDPKKVWQTLYSFRSALAHGSEPKFDKELKLLGDQIVAIEFVESACRAILRHALHEPKLFTDLKGC